ncbi:MAG: TonB-dependent receptor [Bacteroidetes bacterium GWB2_41_8]|nr:MAG: TonB-dependent receptor [Bacteroidetes bacterium GWB2_41_8]
MYIKSYVAFMLLAIISLVSPATEPPKKTDANVFGDVQSMGEHIPFVSIFLEGTTIGTTTDNTGHYILTNLPVGKHVLVAKTLGYKVAKKNITVELGKSQEINFVLEEEHMTINQVVVTGTKTFKRQTESPVIVNVLESKALEMVQACNISEGLRFQPGLRVETDCQTCNYTQLRMNGLGGSYSQILINGRPIFSPLTGLYGMEQIPANMVERIEVVRGGGSALYGSSAIGGTVNIITRIPNESSYDFSAVTQSTNGAGMDNVLNGNLTMLTNKRKAGAAIFVNRRHREAYDHNGDNFSELPQLRNNSFGANLFFNPTYNQKLELNFSSLNEYRYGGEMTTKPAFLAQQSEERTHHVFMGGADYQINFNNDNSAFIAYFAGQQTDRLHYTGIIPDDEAGRLAHVNKPPYGTTANTTLQGGVQVNHRFQEFLGGSNVMTFGAEYVFDDVLDTIPSYNYEINQQTKNVGFFAQSDWQVRPKLTFLAGLRADKHNLVDKVILSPRFSLLSNHLANTQFRLTWGTGFRAPQSFDTDMHIAFAGGGVSRISLDPDLKEERSNSFSGSVNYDRPTEKFILGFTLEGFYTHLKDVFFLQPIGADEFGARFEKRNGQGATVNGGTLELRGNYNRQLQLEAGITIQQSLYDEAVENIPGLKPMREFLRSPNEYGYLTLSFTPNTKFNASVSSVYTGKMHLAHFAGAPEQTTDEYKTSPSFTELNAKVSYTFNLPSADSGLEIFAGVKNLTNAYQSDFDSGKNRDSNYVYGPGMPRSIYLGVRLKSF